VVEGEVQLTRTDETGKSLILQRASAGSILAEASIFSDVYHCDAIASAPSKAFAVAKPLLRQRLSTDAALAEAWAAYLARQVQQARFRCEILALRTVAERLDMWLSWQDDARASRTWLSVAREIGVSPEALYRELAKRRLR
jgi:CRP-like cAMP-binding protein